MNQAHLEFCASEEWAVVLQDQVLPWALGTGTWVMMSLMWRPVLG